MSATWPKPPHFRKSWSLNGTANKPPPRWPCPLTPRSMTGNETGCERWRLSVSALGQILMEEGNPECLPAYREALDIAWRIGDKAGRSC